MKSTILEDHSSESLLQLVPLVPHSKGRPFPMDLGRVELVTWWLNSCCRGRVKRQILCHACQSLVANARFLSKSMLRLDASGTMHVTGKNSKCMFLNDTPVGAGRMSIQEGDVLSFRSDNKSPAWMRFQFCRMPASIVTPEPAKKIAAVKDRSVSKCQSSQGVPNSESEASVRHKRTIDQDPVSGFVRKRKRPESDDESPYSRRKLFAGPLEQGVAPLTQKVLDPVTSSCETAKRGHLNIELQASQESSVLSLPQFPSSESCESDGHDLTPNCDKNKEFHSKTTSSRATSPSCNDTYSPEWQLASDLDISQWKSLQQSAATGSRVRIALAKLVVARNSSRHEKDIWLPDLLQGTLISKKSLNHK